MTSGTRKAKRYAEHQDKKLDEALEETFPASDPLAQTDPSRSIIAPEERGKRRRKVDE